MVKLALVGVAWWQNGDPCSKAVVALAETWAWPSRAKLPPSNPPPSRCNGRQLHLRGQQHNRKRINLLLWPSMVALVALWLSEFGTLVGSRAADWADATPSSTKNTSCLNQ